MAEWTASTPYATNRIAALHRFARDPLYLTWAPRFAENATAPEVTDRRRRTVYAGFWRRAWAFVIDVLRHPDARPGGARGADSASRPATRR